MPHYSESKILPLKGFLTELVHFVVNFLTSWGQFKYFYKP